MQVCIMSTGTRNSGHTSPQRPQRMQGLSGFFSTSSSRKQVSEEEFFVTGTSVVYMACPIMGPPESIFFGSPTKPPAASMMSL